VSSGTVSPVLAGREDELAALDGAFAAAAGGTPATVLVGAEAGGGKSRLAAEFTARVRDRALVLTGGCVELTAGGLPYAPFAAALRGLIRERGAAQVAALLPGRAGGELAALLPEFGVPPPGADPQTARARLFELLLTLLEALGADRPVVLVVEDLHWADRETCDLLSFLVRNLGDAAVLLVVTFRSENLHGDQLLRRLVAGLERMDGVTRLDLPRLSLDQVAAQLAGILGRPPDPPVLSSVYQRGGGNPLFTEALLGPGGAVSPGLPLSLRDLLLASVQDLPEHAAQAVRTAAVGGARIGHALLAAVTGLDDTALTAALRPAVAASVLASEADSYAFRHELIREAVLSDLLAGERAQAHRRFAEALEADPSLSLDGSAAVQVARHWLGAREIERAMVAAWRAAAGAGAAFAYAEQLMMAEQVLELWDQVPDAARQTGTDRIGVLMLAADAARWAGYPERGLELAEAALAESDEAAGEPARRASLLRRRAGLLRELMLPGQLDDLRAALRLVSAAAPALARAQVLAELCWALMREDRLAAAVRAADELDDLARRLRDEEYQAEALLARAALRAREGENTRGELDAARQAAVRIGSGRLEAWAYLTVTNTLEALGDHELAIQAGREGLARARQLGLGRQLAATIAANLAESLTSTGRWDEAAEILDEVLGLDLPPLERFGPSLIRARIALARGERENALRILGELRSLPAGRQAETEGVLPVAELEIGCRLAEGELTGALDAAAAVPAQDLDAYPRYSWPLLATAMQACADAAGAGLGGDAAPPAELRTRLQRRAAALPRLSRLQEAHAATFAAESSRAGGGRDQAGWDAAAAAWEGCGQPYPRAYALLRAAGVAAAAGDRDGAAGRLRLAAGLASQLGARPLQEQIGQLARRARVELAGPAGGQSPGGPAVPFGLTPRELEVLRLVAAGRANPDIAAELFISRRTASVHVSNILGKLGVSSRGEAAALAHRRHLFDQP
jgi:DNA-binding CsgD family transcriptional regulator